MKRLGAFAALAVALALPLSAITAPAEAHNRKPVKSSVEITTRYATAQGDYYYDTYAEKWVIFRPIYSLRATVVCRAGARGGFGVSPVYAMTIGGFDFTCTGKKQTLTFTATGAVPAQLGLSRQRPTATLYLYNAEGTATAVDSDTRTIRVRTVPR